MKRNEVYFQSLEFSRPRASWLKVVVGSLARNPLVLVILMAAVAPLEAASFKERFNKAKNAITSKSSGSFVAVTIQFRGDEVVVKLPSEGDGVYREAVSMIKNGGDIPAAEKSLRGIVQNQPGFAPAWLALGITQEMRGELKEALNSFIKADADKNEKVKEEAASGIARVKQLARYKGITL